MDNLYLTFFLLFLAFSSFETKRKYYEIPCDGDCPPTPYILDDFYNDCAEMIENLYNQKSNDQESGLIDSFWPIGHLYDYGKSETDIVGCFEFKITKKKCEDPIVNETDPSCNMKVCLIHKKRKIISIFIF